MTRDFIFIPNRVYPTSYQREAKKKKKAAELERKEVLYFDLLISTMRWN